MKSLVNKLWAKAVLLASTVALLMSCPNPVVQNYEPNVKISASSKSLKRGEKTNLVSTWSDPNGSADLIDYKLGIDKNGNNQIDPGEELIEQCTPILNYQWSSDNVGTFRLLAEGKDKAGAVGRDAVDINVANAVPTGDFSGINTNLDELEDRVWDLPTLVDADTPGDIPYTSAVAVSGNRTPILDAAGKKLTTKSNGLITQDAPYRIAVTAGSPEGGISTFYIDGTEKNWSIIKGRLESVKEHGILKAGEVRLYNASLQRIGGQLTPDGEFCIKLEPCQAIKLEGRVGENGFWKKIPLNGNQDNEGVLIRSLPAVSELDFNLDGSVSVEEKQTLVDFLRQAHFHAGYGLVDGIKRLNFGENVNATLYQGLQILSSNLTPSMQGTIYNNFLTQGFLQADKLNITTEDETSLKHYTPYGGGFFPTPGWGIVYGVSPGSLGTDGAGNLILAKTDVFDTDGDGYTDAFRIRIATNYATHPRVTNHELTQAILYPGDVDEFDSIMTRYFGVGPSTLQDLDKVGNWVIYEPTNSTKSDDEDVVAINSD